MCKPFFIILLCALLVACVDNPKPPLRVGFNSWAGYAPLYLARERGYYNEDIKLVALPSASATLHAMRMRTLEAAALTLDEALLLEAEGVPVKVILIFDISAGADAVLAKADFEFPNDLSNARIVVERSAVGALMLDAFLQKAGRDANDVQLIDCPMHQHLQCFNNAELVVTYEPMKTQVRKRGAKVLFTSKEMPGQIVDVLVVLNNVEQDYATELTQLVAGYFQARKLMDEQAQLANTLMAPVLKLTAEEVAQAFQGLHLPSLAENKRSLAGPTPALQLKAQGFADFLYQRKLLFKQVSVENFVSNDYLPKSGTNED